MTEALQLSLFDDVFDQDTIEDRMIEKALLLGSGFVGGKERIWQFAQTRPTINELSNFLRHEYGIGGWAKPELRNGELHEVYYDPKGMTLHWMQDDREVTMEFSWPNVARVLKSMIERGMV